MDDVPISLGCLSPSSDWTKDADDLVAMLMHMVNHQTETDARHFRPSNRGHTAMSTGSPYTPFVVAIYLLRIDEAIL